MNAPPDYWKQRKPRVAFLYVEVVTGAEGVYELPLDGGGDDHLQDVTVLSYDQKPRTTYQVRSRPRPAPSPFARRHVILSHAWTSPFEQRSGASTGTCPLFTSWVG